MQPTTTTTTPTGPGVGAPDRRPYLPRPTTSPAPLTDEQRAANHAAWLALDREIDREAFWFDHNDGNER